MPKIGNHAFEIAGKTILLDISYFKKEKKFAIKMPENMARALKGWSPAEADKYKMIDVFGPTEDEVVSAFEKEVKAFEAAVTKKEKVILYAVAGSSEEPIRNDLEKIARELGNWGRKPEWIGLLVRHRIAYKTVVENQVSYRDEDGSEVAYSWRAGKDSLTHAIEWTPEREQFFVSLKAQLERMVARAVEFLDKKPDEMTIFIDSRRGGTLLTGPEK